MLQQPPPGNQDGYFTSLGIRGCHTVRAHAIRPCDDPYGCASIRMNAMVQGSAPRLAQL